MKCGALFATQRTWVPHAGGPCPAHHHGGPGHRHRSLQRILGASQGGNQSEQMQQAGANVALLRLQEHRVGSVRQGQEGDGRHRRPPKGVPRTVQGGGQTKGIVKT